MTEFKPLCFVLMPFGQKPDPTGGRPIDFDRVYEAAIAPAIESAGMTPIRADEERTGGIIHKPMFERLMLCEYAIADLTTANANVFYELGVRHAARPRSTLSVFASHHPLPFDVVQLRAVPYDLGADNAFSDEHADAFRQTLADTLVGIRDDSRHTASIDSPIFQLLGDWDPGQLARLKTDVFRDQVRLNEDLKARMRDARKDSENGVATLDALRTELGDLDVEEAGVIIDLLLSYRAHKAWARMIDLAAEMPEALKRQILVREQLAFALNRRAADGRPEDRDRALAILKDVVASQGMSSETGGLIGRIYKDLWDEARKASARKARGFLREAIDAYRRGFEADWRDAYPGVNLVTLLDVLGGEPALAERDRVLPVVRYAVERRLASGAPDYWDHATMLELAVLASASGRSRRAPGRSTRSGPRDVGARDHGAKPRAHPRSPSRPRRGNDLARRGDPGIGGREQGLTRVAPLRVRPAATARRMKSSAFVPRFGPTTTISISIGASSEKVQMG